MRAADAEKVAGGIGFAAGNGDQTQRHAERRGLLAAVAAGLPRLRWAVLCQACVRARRQFGQKRLNAPQPERRHPAPGQRLAGRQFDRHRVVGNAIAVNLEVQVGPVASPDSPTWPMISPIFEMLAEVQAGADFVHMRISAVDVCQLRGQRTGRPLSGQRARQRAERYTVSRTANSRVWVGSLTTRACSRCFSRSTCSVFWVLSRKRELSVGGTAHGQRVAGAQMT